MRDDIKSLKVCGGKFVPEVTLPLFGNKTQVNKKTPLSILYGRNGSGKSTIARAFRKISNVEEDGISSAILCDEAGNVIQLADDEKGKIYVFDQKFIDENIRIEENGLDTIVMLGNQVEIESQIKNLEQEIIAKKADLENIRNNLAQYSDKHNPKSPYYYKSKTEEALRGDNNWAGRDKDIHSRKINTKVMFDRCEQFIYLNPTESRDKLIVSFDNIFKDLEKARNGNQRIDSMVPINIESIDINITNNLLKEKIEEPILNERDKFLLEISKERSTEFLQDVSNTFSRNDTKNCPFCARVISKDEKEDLVKGIEKILGDLVKDHQRKLESVRPKVLDFDLSKFLVLGELTSICMDRLEAYNRLVKICNEQISSKIANPYKPISDVVSAMEFNNRRADLLAKLSYLEKEREKYNSKISDIKPIVSKLTQINDQIAYYDICEHYRNYRKRLVDMEEIKTKCVNEERALKKSIDEYKGLVAKQNNVDIAVDFINNGLSYIFFSKERLKLKHDNGKYQLLVNGKTVQPSQISTGETNAIALCYFFSKIGYGKSLKNVYNENYLIVIDDPITSFDIENKVGMLSYLKSEVQKFVLGNLETKFLIMTHDMMTFINISHIEEELGDIIRTRYSQTNGLTLQNENWLLFDFKLEKYISKDSNEYSRLIQTVYSFVKDDLPSRDIPIGNIMRQLMEAFATFQYKLGIVELSSKESIINLLPEEYREVFKNYMYRLILNGESHKQDEAKFCLEMDFKKLYTIAEEKRTAKFLICFLYLLNKEHILAHLCFRGDGCELKNKQIKPDLDAWCKEIIN